MTASNEAPGGAVHPNVAAYFRLIDAFNRNDLETVGSLIDADVEYTIPGRSPIACRTRGLGPHLASLKAARQRSGNTLALEPLCVTAGGDRVFVYGRIRAARGDKRLDSDHYVVFRFAGGRIVEGMTLPVDQYAFDDFWA